MHLTLERNVTTQLAPQPLETQRRNQPSRAAHPLAQATGYPPDIPAREALPTTWEEASDCFVQYCLQDRHYSPATARAYASDLRGFAQFLRQSYGPDLAPAQVMVEHVAAFIQSLRGLASSTKHRKLDCLSSFFRYAVAQGWSSHNPVEHLPRPKQEQHLPAWLPQEDVQALDGLPLDERERAILLVFLLTGLRRQELINLDVPDFDPTGQVLRIRHGKGGKDRLLPVSPAQEAALRTYLAQRPKTQSVALFLNQTGTRLHVSSLQRMTRRWFRDAGLEGKQYTIHSFRHSFATQALRAGVDLRTLQELMGHEDLATTAGYLHTDPSGRMSAATKLESMMLPTQPAALSPPPPLHSSAQDPTQLLQGLARLDQNQLRQLADLVTTMAGPN